MRRIEKGQRPGVLVASADKWTVELLKTIAEGRKPTKAQKNRYNHPEIKGAVIAETFGKCAYCESKVLHIDHGDIEHIIPKSKVPEKAFFWENLTLACRICNQNKGDFYDETDPETLIDPSVDDPMHHFLFSRELITPRPDSPRGYETEAVLKLMRGELLERRRGAMDSIDGMVRAYHLAQGRYKALLKEDLYKRAASDGSEYAAFARAYLAHLAAVGVFG